MPIKKYDRFAFGIVDPDHTRKTEFPDSTSFIDIDNFVINNSGTVSKRGGFKLLFESEETGQFRINAFGKDHVLVVNLDGGTYTYTKVNVLNGISSSVNDVTYLFNLSLLKFSKVEEGLLLFDGIVQNFILIKEDLTIEVYPTTPIKPEYVKSVTVHQGSLVVLHGDGTGKKFFLSVSKPALWREYLEGTGEKDTSFKLVLNQKVSEKFYNIYSLTNILIVASNIGFYSVISIDNAYAVLSPQARIANISVLGSGNRELLQVSQFLFYIATDLKTVHLKDLFRQGFTSQLVDQDVVARPQYAFKNTIFRMVESQNATTSELFMLSAGEVFKFGRSATNYNESGYTFAITKFFKSKDISVEDMAFVTPNIVVLLCNYNGKRYLATYNLTDPQRFFVDLYSSGTAPLFTATIDQSQVTTPADQFIALDVGSLLERDNETSYVITGFIDARNVTIDAFLPNENVIFKLKRKYIVDEVYKNKTIQVVSSDGVYLGETTLDETGYGVTDKSLEDYTYGVEIDAKIQTGFVTAEGEVGHRTVLEKVYVQDLSYEEGKDRKGLIINSTPFNSGRFLYEIQLNQGFTTNASITIKVEDFYPTSLTIDMIMVEYSSKTM